jgi:hypothetical protein
MTGTSGRAQRVPRGHRPLDVLGQGVKEEGAQAGVRNRPGRTPSLLRECRQGSSGTALSSRHDWRLGDCGRRQVTRTRLCMHVVLLWPEYGWLGASPPPSLGNPTRPGLLSIAPITRDCVRPKGEWAETRGVEAGQLSFVSEHHPLPHSIWRVRLDSEGSTCRGGEQGSTPPDPAARTIADGAAVDSEPHSARGAVAERRALPPR